MSEPRLADLRRRLQRFAGPRRTLACMATGRLAGLVLDEGKWLAFAMVVAALVVGTRALRPASRPSASALPAAPSLFTALVIGIMGFGHLLAVTVKLAQGTLQGSPWVLYPLGLALVIPATWLARVALRPAGERAWRRRLAALNGALALVVVALGLHNVPLAVPALLNVACLLSSRRALGWTFLGAALLANLALLAGALVFAASGQSFEQFRAQYEDGAAGR